MVSSGRLAFVLLLSFALFSGLVGSVPAPQQVHTTIGVDSKHYVVSWVTFECTGTISVVEYGETPEKLSHTASDRPVLFNNSCGVCRLMHDVQIPANPGSMVYYRVSSGGRVWSGLYTLVAMQPDEADFTMSLLGDMGINSPISSVPQLIADTYAQRHQMVLHYGDIAYNIDDQCGGVGDMFMNAASAYASQIPVVFGVGNHETSANYTYIDYLMRYAGQKFMAGASGSPNFRFLSFEVGPVHFALVDTDAYIYEPVFPLCAPQYAWLERDLQSVNRTRTPWLILIGHRAMYCDLATDDPECMSEAETIRNGRGGSYGLEPLMLKYGVDMYFAGHTHHYQREWPVARGAAVQQSYVEPRAPVHIQSGIAGVDGGEAFPPTRRPYTAFRDEQLNVGFSRLIFHNRTHLTFQQLFAVNGTVLDTFTLVQHNHGPFSA